MLYISLTTSVFICQPGKKESLAISTEIGYTVEKEKGGRL